MSCVYTLKKQGLKLTPQRMLIVDVIHDTQAHLTAEEIIGSVQSRMPGVNKSTIYRTLELLEKAGCVYKSELDSGFVYHHAEEGHHHHLVCSRCGKTINCAENLFAPVERIIMEKYKFLADFKHVIIHGICGECRNKNN
ncbi:MAG: transcriptional repressor [Chloroflexi bacterium RBG_16_50_11]|nr:MAG: transcriptional repressor [Chloroflexi bacterium RBG_16_50_11]